MKLTSKDDFQAFSEKISKILKRHEVTVYTQWILTKFICCSVHHSMSNAWKIFYYNHVLLVSVIVGLASSLVFLIYSGSWGFEEAFNHTQCISHRKTEGS